MSSLENELDCYNFRLYLPDALAKDLRSPWAQLRSRDCLDPFPDKRHHNRELHWVSSRLGNTLLRRQAKFAEILGPPRQMAHLWRSRQSGFKNLDSIKAQVNFMISTHFVGRRASLGAMTLLKLICFSAGGPFFGCPRMITESPERTWKKIEMFPHSINL